MFHLIRNICLITSAIVGGGLSITEAAMGWPVHTGPAPAPEVVYVPEPTPRIVYVTPPPVQRVVVPTAAPTPRPVYAPPPPQPTLPPYVPVRTQAPTAAPKPTAQATAPTTDPCAPNLYGNGQPYEGNWISYDSTLICVGNSAMQGSAAPCQYAPADGEIHDDGAAWSQATGGIWCAPPTFSDPPSFIEHNPYAGGEVVWYLSVTNDGSGCETMVTPTHGSALYCQ